MPLRQVLPTSVGLPLSHAANRSAIARRENAPESVIARAMQSDISVSSVTSPGCRRSQPPPTMFRCTPNWARTSLAVKNSTVAPRASPTASPTNAARARARMSCRSMDNERALLGIGKSRVPTTAPSDGQHLHRELSADHEHLALALEDAVGQEVAREEDARHGDLRLEDGRAELPGPLAVVGEGREAVHAQEAVAAPRPLEHLVLGGVVDAAPERQPALAGAPPRELVLRERVEEVELRGDGVRAGVAAHAVERVALVRLGVDAVDAAVVVRGRQAHAAL